MRFLGRGTCYLKQPPFPPRHHRPDVFIRLFRRGAPSWSALDVAFHDEERLVHLLDGAGLFAYCRCDGGEADGTAFEFVDNRRQDADVHFVETCLIHVEGGKAIAGDFLIHRAVAFYLGKVTDAAKQRVGDARCAATAPGDFMRALWRDGDVEDGRRAVKDAFERRHVVVVEVAIDAEAGAKRRGEQSHARGGTDEGEWVECDLDAAGVGAGVNHDVYAVVLHGGVEVFFDDGVEPVDFINEQHVAGFKVGEQAGKVAGFFEHGAAAHFQ